MKYFFIVSLFKLVLELPILRFLFPLHHPPATAIAFPEYSGGTEVIHTSNHNGRRFVAFRKLILSRSELFLIGKLVITSPTLSLSTLLLSHLITLE